jgi:hypothetical protein
MEKGIEMSFGKEFAENFEAPLPSPHPRQPVMYERHLQVWAIPSIVVHPLPFFSGFYKGNLKDLATPFDPFIRLQSPYLKLLWNCDNLGSGGL